MSSGAFYAAVLMNEVMRDTSETLESLHAFKTDIKQTACFYFIVVIEAFGAVLQHVNVAAKTKYLNKFVCVNI